MCSRRASPTHALALKPYVATVCSPCSDEAQPCPPSAQSAATRMRKQNEICFRDEIRRPVGPGMVVSASWALAAQARAWAPRGAVQLVATRPDSSSSHSAAGGGRFRGSSSPAAHVAPRALTPSARVRAQAKHRLIVLFARARDAQQRGLTSLARSLLERCLAIDKDDAHAVLALARLEAASGNEERAQRLFVAARAARPANVRLVHAHGVFEARCGRPAAAREAFRACEALEPGSSYAIHSWGLLEESLGKVAAARAVYARSPDSPTVLAAWAALESHQVNTTHARSLYRAACVASGLLVPPGPDRPGCVVARGRGSVPSPAEAARLFIDWSALETRTGSLRQARSLLGKARAIAPHNAAVTVALADLEWSSGRLAAGRQVLRAAVDEMQAAVGAERRGRVAARARGRRSGQGRGPGAAGSLGNGQGTVRGEGRGEGSARGLGRGEGSARGLSAREAALVEVYNGWAALEARCRRGGVKRALRLLGQAAAVVEAAGVAGGNSAPEAGGHGNGGGAGGGGSVRGAPAAVPADVAGGSATRPRIPAAGLLFQSRGALLHQLGDLSGARDAYRRAVTLGCGAPAYVGWARLEEEHGDPALAEQLFSRGAEVDPDHAPLHNARAAAAERRGQMHMARQVYSGACTRGACAALLHGWGQLELRDGKHARASALFERAATCGRGSAEDRAFAHHALGHARLRQRRLNEAHAAFTAGLALSPESSQLILGLALVHAHQRNDEAARALFSRAVRIDPRHAHAWRAWGVMEARLGETDAARQILADGLRSCRGYAPLWLAAARVEKESGHLARARRLLQDGVDDCGGGRDGPANTARGGTRGARAVSGAGLAALAAAGPGASLAEEVDASTSEQLDTSVAADVDASLAADLDASLAEEVDASLAGELDASPAAMLAALAEADEDESSWGEPGQPAAKPVDASLAASSLGDGSSRISTTAKAPVRPGGAARGGSAGALLLSWAALELGAGRNAACQQLLSRARSAGADPGPAYQLQAVLLERQGLQADARAVVEEGIRVAPSHAPLHCLRGCMLDAAKDVDGARAAFAEALRLHPGDGRTFHAWASLEARLLNWEGLARLNEQARASFPPDRMPPLVESRSDAL